MAFGTETIVNAKKFRKPYIKGIYEKKSLLAVMPVLFSLNAFAGTGNTAPVQVENVSIIAGAPYALHQARNMEIKIKNGFNMPSGVFCDPNYVTTKLSMDPDRAMMNLLRDALVMNRLVVLHVTDSSAQNAYPGRCSLVAVELW